MKRRILALLWLSALVLPAPPAGTLWAAKYPPGLRWREIERNGFTIIFPAERTAEAMAALAAAEALSEDLASFWRFRLPGRTRIVLSDNSDQANGFATFFPFNLVGADLAEPPPDSELAGRRGWIELVLAHELTHLFTMNAGSPPFHAGRRLFGSLPFLYPAVQMPPWAIEGLAVEGESRFTGDGRLDHPPYRLMLEAARRDGLFPSWNPIAGMPAAWPGPTAKYLFGAGFMKFLTDRYGADSLRKYMERTASQLVLFGSSRDFKKIFGQPLGKLWEEYKSSVPDATGPAPELLKGGGFYRQYPCPLGENGLIFYRHDYQSQGEVVWLDLKNGQSRALFKKDSLNALSYDEKEDKILLSAADYFRAFSDYSDLYEYDVKNKRLKRLSRGQRLSQPAKRGNSDEIYCIQRHDGRFCLAVFDAQKGNVRPVSRPFPRAAQPSVSPDGSMVAAAVKPEGGPWGIGLFSTSGESGMFITAPGADLSQPRWLNDRQVFFILAGRETARLATLSLAGNGGSVCDDPRLSGLRQFAFSGDGGEVYFTYFSGSGLAISRLAIQGLPFSPMNFSVAQGIPEAKAAPPEPAPAPSRPYRFWRDLLPRWWSPALRAGGDEVQAGVMTGGQDAPGIHSYSIEGYYGFSSRRANVLFQYVYDGLFPTLSLAYKDSVDYYRGSRSSMRTRELKLASLWPLRIRKRSQLFAYADLHLERRSYSDEGNAIGMEGSYNGFCLGMDFNSAREYYDSVSPADGASFALQGFFHPKGLGNERANHGVQLDLRHYIPLFRPGVLAWRLAAARSWDAGNHYYDMGGLTAGSGLGKSQPFKLLRGFEAGYHMGDRGWQFNLEYRLPLLKIEKALLPAVSLDRVWLAPFLDMGRLSSEYYTHPVAYSAGGEMVLRLAFGGAAAYDLAFGFAHGFGPERQYWIYFRTGRSF